VPTWEQERAAVFAAICALRQLGETLTERVAELRHERTRELGMLGAWRALNRWEHEERTQIEEAAGHSRDDEQEIPSLRSLRQN
jgi:hypothetical protein